MGIAFALLSGCSNAPPAGTNTPGKPTAVATSASPKASATASATASASATPSGSATPGATATGTESPSADSNRYEAEEAGIELTIPSGWHHEKKDNGVVVAAPADDSCGVIFMTPPEDDMEKVGEEVGKLLGEIITDMKTNGEPKKGEFNGMKTVTVEGTGKSGGKDCEWSVDFVQNKKILMVVFVGEKAGIEKNKGSLTELAKSIKKMD